jgi:hypothetical protein
LARLYWYEGADVHTPLPFCILCTRLVRALQKVRNRDAARICCEAHHAGWASAYINAVRLHENGVAYADVERSNAGAAAYNQKPSLLFRLQAPSGGRRQIDHFEHEVCNCD